MAVQDCIGGVVPPIVTPLTEDGAVDVLSLRRLVGYLLDRGARGVFALGSTGEATYLSNSARRDLVAELGSSLSGDVPILVGVVESTVDRVVEQADFLATNADAALVVTGPFYAKPSSKEIQTHFEQIARRTGRPVVAYNIPVNVGYPLPYDLIEDLTRRGVVVGLKDSSPDLDGFGALVKSLEDVSGALLFTGSDAYLDKALQLGANGVVAGLANVAPQRFVAALAAHANGDAAALASAQADITALTELYVQEETTPGLNSTQLGSIKTALQELKVIESDTVSAPMIRSSYSRRERIRIILHNARLVAVSA